MLPALTTAQQRVYDFCKESLKAQDQLPPAEKIAEHCGFAGKSGARCHLAALVKKGYLEANAFGKLRFVRS